MKLNEKYSMDDTNNALYVLQYIRLPISYQLSLHIFIIAKAVLHVRSMLFFEVHQSRATSLSAHRKKKQS